MSIPLPNARPIPPPQNLPFLSADFVPPSSLPPSSLLFPSILSVLNRSFSASHHTSTRSNLPAEYPRMPTAEHFLADVGKDGFTILLRGQRQPFEIPDDRARGREESGEGQGGAMGVEVEGPEIGGLAGAEPNTLTTPAPEHDPFPCIDLGPDTVIGTISARPHDPVAHRRKPKKEDARFTMFLTYPDVSTRDGEGTEIRTWELKLMAVDLAWQRQGVADWLLGKVLEEARRREGRGTYKIRLLLSTIKEINLGFYTKKGYTWVQDIPVEKGVLGSRDGFTVVWLEKMFEA